MKTKLYLWTFFLIIVNCIAPSLLFAQNFQWANSVGGNQDEYGESVATDLSGNVYVTGYYNSPTITFGTTTFTNSGSYDIFLVKYDASGNVLWAKTAVGSSYNYAHSVATDCGVGHVIITGSFGGSVTFGSTTLTNSSGGADIFVAEYDSNGNVLWAKSAGGSGSEHGYSVVTDYSCNLYVTGYFDSPTLTMGSTTLTNTSAGFQNVFLAKYDTSGNVVWARSAGGSGNVIDQGKSVAYNNSGVYLTGEFSNSITFGSTTLASLGSNDVFIAKYDTNGNLIWAKSAGGTLDEVGVSVTANANTNNVYLTGNFNSPTSIFGSTTLTNASPGPSFYYDDIFIAKYDLAGNVVWAKSAGGMLQDRAIGIGMDQYQNTYVTGNFKDTIAFDSTTLITTGGNSEIFIVKYDLNGNAPWAKRAGGNGSDSPGGIVSNNNGTFAYVVGTYSSSTIDFDLLTLNNVASNDFFLTKLINLPTEIDNSGSPNDFVIYPNPSSGIFTITSKINGEISIYNTLGETIFSSVIDPLNSKLIDISDKPSGVYFLVFMVDDTLKVEKIIVQH